MNDADDDAAADAARPGVQPSVERIVDALEAAGDREVLRHPDGVTTGADLLAAVRRYARALDGLGIGSGDLVAQYAPNRPDALAVRYATHLIGAGAVYLSAPPGAERRARQLEQIDPRLVVVFPQTARWLPRTTAPVAAVGPVEGVELRLDELAAAASSAPFASRSRPGDLGTVLSSGGTTGIPKASVRDVAAWAAAVATPPRPERRQLASGAEAYLTQILVTQTIIGGGTVVLRDDSEPAALLAQIEAERITDLFLVEPQLVALMDHPDVGRRDLSSLRTLTHIGASAPPALRRRARQRLGPVLAHTYGASEMGIVSALGPDEYGPDDAEDPGRATSAGRIRPGVAVRFRRDDGTLDPTSGRIEVRSPAMAQGYRNRPQEQAEHFVDGWYRTGDLGRLDADGRLQVHGRAADCAVVEGRLITPVALEDTLMDLPAVRYAVVVADLAHGRRVAAVQPWPGQEVDARACRAAVAAGHGGAVAATLAVVGIDELPLTEQGKPDRAAILARPSS